MPKGEGSRFRRCPLVSERLKAYIDSETLIIFDEKSGYVFGLEKESAALFLHMDELLHAYSEDEVLKLFPDTPQDYLKKIIDLRECRTCGNESYEPPFAIGPYKPDQKKRVDYDTGEITFSIAYPDRTLFDAVDPLFVHIFAKRQGNRRVNVDFSRVDDGWQIFFNKTPVAKPTISESLPLVLQENMIILHYQSSPYLIAMHAGAVGTEAEAVLLPGASGSGKSTLAAAMAAGGYELYSDEIALVKSDGRVSPLPFSINIKEGSWGLLGEMFPSLPGSRSYLRFDSQRVKMLPPPNPAKNRAAIRAIVFPEFDERYSETTLEPLNSCETLSRIKEAGYQLEEPLTQRSLEKILSAVLEPDAYLLKYGSLEEAVKKVGSLLDG